MKSLSSIFLSCSLALVISLGSRAAFANASQPGVWNAGGTVFTMLYPEDSLSFKKVQMQQERIFIQLYKNFAVVKGVYLFRNTSADLLNFRMGYPVNGIYHGGGTDRNEVVLDSLSCFKIRTKTEWIPLLKQPHTDQIAGSGQLVSFGDNWMVWEMTFLPEETQTVEVYFLVNTNRAMVRQGYEKEPVNAFIYLLESGSVWHPPIEKGQFYIQLMDGMNKKNIHGLSPGFGFRYNELHTLYSGTKSVFSPTPKDNLVATYDRPEEPFTFEKITNRSELLFASIDSLSILPLDSFPYTPIRTGDPYETKKTFRGNLPALLTRFVTYAPFITAIALLSILLWAFIKWRKLKHSKKN